MFVIKLDGYSDIRTHWIALYLLNNTVTYFVSFGEEHIPKEVKIFICINNIKRNISRRQAYDLIIWDICALDLLILCLQ